MSHWAILSFLYFNFYPQYVKREQGELIESTSKNILKLCLNSLVRRKSKSSVVEILEPLHTQAKGCDHVSVRALDSHHYL